jgi:formylglycine-generating enzyme required for sulfatase activity
VKKTNASPLASAALAALLVALGTGEALAITIPTVPVGNAGNANDPLTGNLYGGVTYAYRIGTTEVTNDQYAEFLNAKAASDPLALYYTSMGSDASGGIARSGSGTIPDPYVYTTKTNMGNKPVNYVNWYDSIRFANWLNNGQGLGDTETGAYTLLGGTPVPSNGTSITRNSGALWFLPTEHEWYKAAYHQPSVEGGDSDDYWLYPTASNTDPTIATANSVGDISNPGSNVANYALGAAWDAEIRYVTTVGSAGPLSQGFYGTADQGGNVWEWNEPWVGEGVRSLRGGALAYSASSMRATTLPLSAQSNFQAPYFGFRVAAVPEPSTAVLAIVGCGLMWLLRRRFK